VFYTNGTADQVDMNGVATVISGTANTFFSGSSVQLPQAVQWGNQGILIISSAATNSYYAWDNSKVLLGPGNAAPGWASGTAYIKTTANTHTNTTLDGIPSTTGMAVGNFVTFAGQAASGITMITVVVGANSLTINQAATATTTGVVLNVLSNFTTTGNTHSNTTVDTLASTTGISVGMTVLSSAGDIPQGTTVVSIAGSTITISQAATGTNTGVTLGFGWAMPTGISGTSIEVYQNRVFINNGNQKSFSAASNAANFAASAGGDQFNSTDGFLKAQFVQDKQSNGFLYSFADSSINVINNIQSTGSPLVTTFNNFNVDPQMGTIWRDTVQPFGRGVMFANPSGVYALYGGAAEKVSDKLDGLFSVGFFTVLIPSSAICTLFGVRVFAINIRTIDYLGVVRNILCMWDGKKWFLSSQSLVTTFIATQEVNSVISMWATDGTNLFQMFQVPSTGINKILQTKLWSGDGYVIVKQAMRNFCLGTDFSGSGFTLIGTLDIVSDIFGFRQIPKTLTSPLVFIQWVNNSVQNVQFRNNSSQNINFLGNTVLQLLGVNVSGSGSLLGETLVSSSSNYTLAALTLQYHRQAPVGG